MNLLTPERFMVDDEMMERDYDRMRRMAPESARRMSDMIEDMCDRLEYEGSFMYDEAPDKTTLLRMTDQNYDKMRDMDPPALKDFIQALLLDEMLYRRCRYQRKKKMCER